MFKAFNRINIILSYKSGWLKKSWFSFLKYVYCNCWFLHGHGEFPPLYTVFLAGRKMWKTQYILYSCKYFSSKCVNMGVSTDLVFSIGAFFHYGNCHVWTRRINDGFFKPISNHLQREKKIWPYFLTFLFWAPKIIFTKEELNIK
jgi:hypothetical protein